jgi:hypothetical protein
MKQFGPGLVVPDSETLIPYHPGARKYFVEQGWLKQAVLVDFDKDGAAREENPGWPFQYNAEPAISA